MVGLYILFTFLIYPITLIASLFSEKAKVFLGKRKADKEKIRKIPYELGINRVLWLHAASVGELDQCKALAKSIKENEPNSLIIQSVFSESVQEKNYDLENTYLSFRLPLDFYFAYDFIFEKFQPDSLVLMAWDSWPNLILAAKRHNCKVFLASAVLDPKSKRTSFFARSLTRAIFARFSGIGSVNESMILPFQELTDNSVSVKSLGDSRFDSVVDKIKSKKPDSKFTEFAESYLKNPVLILASTYKECDEVVLAEIEKVLDLGYSIWIFPHKVDVGRIQEIQAYLRERKLTVSLYSEVKNPCKDRIILFDALGILAFAYFYGKIAYVGGASHNKVHNVLEPAYFGLPLITGSRIFNSFDALTLKEKESLRTVNSSKEFLEAIRIYSEEKYQSRVSATNREYVLSRLGASLAFYNAFLKK
ncbi:MAG: 3-deoxy-D-manno-octulosonic acid transferase [Leptospiraceae bacterium]|nr:3-deoxy-D-manno-octulosonic acid transferase [Leptospiraceae bacterium]